MCPAEWGKVASGRGAVECAAVRAAGRPAADEPDAAAAKPAADKKPAKHRTTAATTVVRRADNADRIKILP
jgi:hypothetical protein